MCSIRVICRLRPENKIEQESGAGSCISYTDTTIKIKLQERSEEVHDFTFDRICGSKVPQQEVFEYAARPVVEGVLDGYNGTIFAYGQTGSGKTFTMEGPDINNQELKGIIPRMMDALFQGLVDASESIEFTLRVSFLEIYLERIHDLLDTTKTNLQVKEDKIRGIYVQNATEIYVSSPLEMMKVMAAGSGNRSIAATRMNERSSRSHSIFCVNVEQKDHKGNKKSGRLYFVDLAGSECVGKTNVSGQQLKEAQMINKSLSALGNVINALTEKGVSYVPYRDSKLTRILQESIGGNSQTSLIIACSMSSYNDKETLSTLRFGQRAKKIQNKPVVNQERNSKELLKQIENLQNELRKQAEIINNIHKYIVQKHPEEKSLIKEIAAIIDGSFVMEKSSTAGSSEKNDSEYSLTLLKQHIEIVKLHEELQVIKLEKKETEDELGYRTKELCESEVAISELQKDMMQERAGFNKITEDLQGQIDKLTAETHTCAIKTSKAARVCERLKSDLLIINKEIPKSEAWSEILCKSIDESITLLLTISDFPTKNLETLDQILTTESSIYENIKIAELQSQLDSVSEKLYEKTSQVHNLEVKYCMQEKELDSLRNTCELLSKQLDTKVKNIEDERASVALEMRYKDIEIEELRKMFEIEREKYENLKSISVSGFESDAQDQVDELRAERQKLFEEIVSLRRDLDMREEQLHTALQKNKRLERQISLQVAHKPSGSMSRAISPGKDEFEEIRFTRKISKPIRGGGGNFSNFQRNNQIFSNNNDYLFRRKSVEKISNQGGLKSMIKDIFGGLLG
ncbi:hypothetical protein SteCoe_8404 [Stentor coeruleus]|uniref:Kinesin-like protein n=1 Tax=Stentor coeruleus TaxID=5963 RepID=A0A1R2CK78_9CILI|nr:hypothetical protein SteCoe_8404 [Stentor coeruleus]